jgi:hypothetical protein
VPKTGQSLAATAAAVTGWALLPSGAIVPIAAAGGVVLMIRMWLPAASEAPPNARQVQPMSLWSDWDAAGPGACKDAAPVAHVGERSLWRVGDGYVVEQGGVYRPVPILYARQLIGL